MLYSVQSSDKRFVKGSGFLPSAKIKGKDTAKNVSKYLNCKHSQKILDHAKKP